MVVHNNSAAGSVFMALNSSYGFGFVLALCTKQCLVTWKLRKFLIIESLKKEKVNCENLSLN